MAKPVDNRLKAVSFPFVCLRAFARGALRRPQSGIGDEEDAFGKADRRALLEARQGCYPQLFHAERRPVTLRVFEELVGPAEQDCLAAALDPVVKDDARDLPRLDRTRTRLNSSH